MLNRCQVLDLLHFLYSVEHFAANSKKRMQSVLDSEFLENPGSINYHENVEKTCFGR